MAKAKKDNTLDTEDQEWLDKIKAENDAGKQAFPQMKQLAINTDMVDAEGNKIPMGTFYIRGEKDYSETVKFRPLAYYSKYIKSVKNDKGWKIENETIFVENFESPLDIKGGIACGRLLGKAIPSAWTESQLKENSGKATCYCFMFGLVEFPGKEPVLVNFRASPAKARVLRETLKPIDRNTLFFNEFTLKLVPVTGTVHPKLEMELTDTTIPTGLKETIKPAYEEAKKFVATNNARILDIRNRVLKSRSASTADTNLYEKVDELSDDFKDEEIPF